MDEMLSHPRIFKGEDFKTLDKLSLKYALQQSSLDTRIDILNIAIKAARKMKTAERPYLELIAQSYEGLSRGKDDMIAVHNAQEAIKYYRQLKNKAKVKELEDRYKDAKQNMELGVVPYEFDRTEIVNAAKGMADNVLKGTTEKILGFLMYSPLVIPTYQSLYDEATKRKGENFLQFLFPTTIFDDFGHTAAHYVETDEKTHLAIMQSFNFRVQVSSLVFIHGVIFGGIKKGKLSSPAFLKFIRHHSWLGQGIKITYSQKEAHTYNWLHTIAPGINDFFSQLYFRNINQLFIPNFVLAIDSLTLKIEGIIRDMCELRGINTFYQTVDSKGRNITREKDINMLLRDDEVKGILSADDLIFLQFLFVDKAGWNLRNKVAHTLMREVQEYGLGQMLLLLLAILRLAKNEYGPQTRP
jgi:hypothetical protein